MCLLLHLTYVAVATDVNIFVDYVEDSADPIPNEDRFCLPTCMTKSEIYNTYVEEMRSAGVKPISLPTFSTFRNVIIPKVNDPYSF